MMNYVDSKNGFLKSIGGGLADILYGPLGCGDVLNPLSKQTYSPASTDETTN
jgi:hypothetical protein